MKHIKKKLSKSITYLLYYLLPSTMSDLIIITSNQSILTKDRITRADFSQMPCHTEQSETVQLAVAVTLLSASVSSDFTGAI